jgi:hypothetical protein
LWPYRDHHRAAEPPGRVYAKNRKISTISLLKHFRASRAGAAAAEETS